jgi:hypothetical protein
VVVGRCGWRERSRGRWVDGKSGSWEVRTEVVPEEVPTFSLFSGLL